jgi:hypothetical protein
VDFGPRLASGQLTRGARRLLHRLLWYGRRYGNIHPTQKKLAKGLDISDRMLRTYLRELKCFVEVRQGGDGHPASYFFTAALPSELASGLLPSCFRAEIAEGNLHPAPNPVVTVENFRAEHHYQSSASSSCSNHSQSTTVEISRAAAETDSTESYSEVARQTLMRQIRLYGFEPSRVLLEKLYRKAAFYGVTLFEVSAHLERAWRKVANTSNRPRTEGWLLAVVENELSGSGNVKSRNAPSRPSERSATQANNTLGPNVPGAAAIRGQIAALSAQKRFGARR